VGIYVQLHAPLPEKYIYFDGFADAASILKNPRIDAGSEAEIVIKLIEKFFFKLLLKI